MKMKTLQENYYFVSEIKEYSESMPHICKNIATWKWEKWGIIIGNT